MLQDLRVRANVALGHVFDENAPQPHSNDYASHLRFFGDVVTRLEARFGRRRAETATVTWTSGYRLRRDEGGRRLMGGMGWRTEDAGVSRLVER